MPDADDFDVEELRALLRGEQPKPDGSRAGTPAAPAASGKNTGAAPRGKAASPRPGGAKRAASRPSSRGRKAGAR
jgi:hypothetical protein